jgi:hypothetical protein
VCRRAYCFACGLQDTGKGVGSGFFVFRSHTHTTEQFGKVASLKLIVIVGTRSDLVSVGAVCTVQTNNSFRLKLNDLSPLNMAK